MAKFGRGDLSAWFIDRSVIFALYNNSGILAPVARSIQVRTCMTGIWFDYYVPYLCDRPTTFDITCRVVRTRYVWNIYLILAITGNYPIVSYHVCGTRFVRGDFLHFFYLTHFLYSPSCSHSFAARQIGVHHFENNSIELLHWYFSQDPQWQRFTVVHINTCATYNNISFIYIKVALKRNTMYWYSQRHNCRIFLSIFVFKMNKIILFMKNKSILLLINCKPNDFRERFIFAIFGN